MLSLKQVLLELGGIGGSGVQTKDGHGPFSGKMDPKKQKLRDMLTTEVPARTSPTHSQMARPTAPLGVPPSGGTLTPTQMQQARAGGAIGGGAFLPPGMSPEEFDTPPEDLRAPMKVPNFPGKAGVGLSRARAGRQEFDPSKMLSPAELAQAKKQLGLEGNMPSLKAVEEVGKYSPNVTQVLQVLQRAKQERWIDKIIQAVPELQQLSMGKRPADVEKAFELSFRELARLLPRE
jgi:hypothetical protein